MWSARPSRRAFFARSRRVRESSWPARRRRPIAAGSTAGSSFSTARTTRLVHRRPSWLCGPQRSRRSRAFRTRSSRRAGYTASTCCAPSSTLASSSSRACPTTCASTARCATASAPLPSALSVPTASTSAAAAASAPRHPPTAPPQDLHTSTHNPVTAGPLRVCGGVPGRPAEAPAPRQRALDHID